MAEQQSVTVTQSEVNGSETLQRSSTLHVQLTKRKTERKVQWSEQTVDNEHLNKKKSKCCCVYEKPREFAVSSSESEDEDGGNCHGHKNGCYRPHKKNTMNENGEGTSGGGGGGEHGGDGGEHGGGGGGGGGAENLPGNSDEAASTSKQ
ncbi:E3 ubiquitin-protein ligase PPP1R11-like [Argonauta hians]